jgi:hypothetical protein
MLRQLFKSLFGRLQGAATPTRPRRRVPRLEALETRLVPSTSWTWVGAAGGTGLWSDSANWVNQAGSHGVPTTGDQLQFGTNFVAGTSVHGTDTPSTDNIANLDVQSVTLGSRGGGFSSTITLAQPLRVDAALSQNGGQVRNAPGDPSLAVNSYHLNAGTLTLQGANGRPFSFTFGDMNDGGTVNLDTVRATSGDGGGGGSWVVESGSQSGTLNVTPTGGGPTVINATVNDAGTVNIASGAMLSVHGNYDNQQGAMTNVGTAAAPGGTLQVSGAGVTMLLGGDLALRNGSLIYNPSTSLPPQAPSGAASPMSPGAGAVTNSGTLEVQGMSMIQAPELDNAGTILFDGQSPATLQVQGNFQQEAGGTLQMRVGDGPSGLVEDQLHVSGAATLAGTLDEAIFSGLSLYPQQSFEPITWGSESGTLTVNPPADYVFMESYQPTGLFIGVVSGPMPQK